MRRSTNASLVLALLGASALAGSAAHAADVGKLLVFGDSYSTLSRQGYLNWPKQLQNARKVGSVSDFAKGGAYAASTVGGRTISNTFAAQLGQWQAKGSPLGDATVAFFGYNDIQDPAVTSFSPSRTGFTKGVNTLIAKGANSQGRELYLVMPHDVGSTPMYNRNATTRQTYRSRTVTWDKFVASTARSKGATAIDLFTVIDKVLKNPKSYGFTNVTTPSATLSKTSYLYYDNFHFGQKGQKLIEQTIAGYLTRAANVAKSLQQSQKTTAQRQNQVQAGQALALAALPEEARLGLVAFPIGPAALPEAEPAGDVTRAGFDQAFDPDRQDGGVGFTYGLADGTEVGVAFTNYGESGRDTVKQEVTGTALASQGVSLSLRHKLGAFALETRLDYGQDRHQVLRYDGITDSHDRAAFDGRTFDLAQRVGYPLQHEGYVLTPWAELSYQSQEVDGFTLKSPFTSDQRYAGATVSDTLGRVGLDAKLDPIAVGEQGWLTLWGGVSYTQGLAQDDYRVRIKEAAFGNTQETVIDRPTAQTLGLTLGASLALGENLALDGDLALDQDLQTGPAGAARLALAYRF